MQHYEEPPTMPELVPAVVEGSSRAGTFLGNFEQQVIAAILVLGENATGSALCQLIKERTGKAVARGAVGTTLDRMNRKGLTTSEWVRDPQRPSQRPHSVYRVLPRGVEALRTTHSAMLRLLADVPLTFE